MLEFSADIAEALIPFAVAWATFKVTQLTNKNIEGKHREVLHSALSTGARLAVEAARRGDISDEIEDLKRFAIDYAKFLGSREAIEALDPGMKGVEKVAESKVIEELRARKAVA